MKFAFLRQDDEGNWFLIPEGFEEPFDISKNRLRASFGAERDRVVEEFDANFSRYRLNKPFNELKVVLED